MNYILNYNYTLRNDSEGVYVLYNKKSLKTYYISCKLYYILKYFYNQAISFSFIRDEGAKHGIDLTDFFAFLEQKDFLDLLIPEPEYKKRINVNYKISDTELPTGTMSSPERVEFFLTRHCNLSCKHCFEGSAPKFSIKDFTDAELERVVEQLEVAGIKTLKITGGEPFSHPNIKKFLTLLANVHYETMILTNALLLDTDHIKMIKKANIQLGISLDGISNLTHDYIRGKGTFLILKGILEELKRNHVTFSITCTVNKRNIFEIEKLIDYVLLELNADSLFVSRLRPVGRAAYNTDLILDDNENKFIQQLCLEKKKYGERLILADDSTMRLTSSINRIACSAGNSLFALDENFDVYPCIFGVGHKEYKIGNLLSQDICDIWKSSKWDIYRGGTTLDVLTDCKDCKLNTYCIMKNYRLRPVFEGQTFYDAVSYCEMKVHNDR